MSISVLSGEPWTDEALTAGSILTIKFNNRSTNLDSWTLSQLRIMKVGGNASAAEFFNKHGGAALLNSSDAKSRYSSSVADRYKAELEKRKQQDEADHPEGIAIDGVDLNKPVQGGSGANSRMGTPAPGGNGISEGTSSEGPNGNGEDDFFSSFDKPASTNTSTKSATPGIVKPIATGPPGIGRRTVTSASLRTGTEGGSTTAKKPASRLGATRLGSSTTTTTTTSSTGGVRASKLGAKKAGAPINFEEAQRKAAEEEERIKKLGYDRKREEEEAREREKKEAEQRARDAESRTSTPTYGSSSAARAPVEKAKPVRLGFGATAASAAASAAATSSGSTAKKYADVDDTRYARDKFSNQKAISSDQYFGRGNYDPQAESEARTRLQNFSGASAISSNAYFGRPEDDEEDLLTDEGGLLGELGQNETVAHLERGIRDMAGRLMASPEVQNLGENLRTGALKVSLCAHPYDLSVVDSS